MNKDVVVLNCGSSSVKFAIIDAVTGKAGLSGLAESLGNTDASLTYKLNGEKNSFSLTDNAGHTEALNAISKIIEDTGVKPIAVGHRVVHGGEKFKEAALVDNEVLAAVEDYASMAPLHNLANLKGIVTAQKAYPNLPHVCVFDTSFFQSMPQKAYIYALPMRLYKEHGIRRYGFHGTSHKFILDSAAKLLDKPVEETSIISAHLGNGCSVTAIEKGKAVDTSLGFTPLEGLVMGTRCGDMDPSLPGTLQKKLGKTADEINDLLNKQSGLLGISELSNDCRTLEEEAEKGHEGALLAIEIFCYRLAKYIASYLIATPSLDAIVFTGGIGENSSLIRETTMSYFAHLGVTLDEQKNLDARFGKGGEITSSSSSKTVFVVPTNEEWVIAAEAATFA
ncbi:MAG: acetate kinase [Alteromonas sp.]|uniref:acetate kinase n=1 Tax=unclassified Alteromonas TaxID=2614992 RepID=UPI0009030FBF|nr:MULTISPECIES: acetate kinase [unclassified Alteromonas]APE05620.1 acetate kinase [Alteromonas sp. RW2A1]AUC87947.1 acetate kinase [Alteromonas sp. MB-3u-76]MAI63371.1 acetate kinase [Alteromonas sp.]